MRPEADPRAATAVPSMPPVQDEPGHLVASTGATATAQAVARRTKNTVTRSLEVKPTFSSIAAVYFFNGRGYVLIQRLYRDGVDHA